MPALKPPKQSIGSQTLWTGTASIGFGWGYFHGTVDDIQPHHHHAVQIVLGLTALKVWLEPAGWRDCQAVVIGANLAHQLVGTGQMLKVVYLDPESHLTRQITRRLRDGWLELNPTEADGLWQQLEPTNHLNLAQTVAEHVCSHPPHYSEAPRSDARIEQMLRDLPRLLTNPITVGQLASRVHLSPSRLQHRFVHHTGMPLRPYVRWLRLSTALTAIAGKASLTEAATTAGFADAAHFSRTFKRHFGFTPWVLWPNQASMWVQVLLAGAVIDFGLYVMHRYSHVQPFLWRLHMLHHSPQRMYWINGGRRHPVSALILAGPALAVLMILGATPIAVAAWLAILSIHLSFQHANLDYSLGPLRYVFCVAENHRWHHKREFEDAQVNFGEVWAIWDRLFSSYHDAKSAPRAGEVGLRDTRVPPTYLGQLAWPFMRSARGSNANDAPRA